MMPITTENKKLSHHSIFSLPLMQILLLSPIHQPFFLFQTYCFIHTILLFSILLKTIFRLHILQICIFSPLHENYYHFTSPFSYSSFSSSSSSSRILSFFILLLSSFRPSSYLSWFLLYFFIRPFLASFGSYSLFFIFSVFVAISFPPSKSLFQSNCCFKNFSF